MIRRPSVLLVQSGAPPREFWENELEMSIDPVLAKAAEPGFIERWLAGRHSPEFLVLHRLIDVRPGRARVKRGRTLFVPYVLIHEFMKHNRHSIRATIPAD